MPDATDLGRVARHLWQLTEPIHAVVYFSPEPIAAMKAAGYRGYWMGYFAQRSAPLGEVPPEVVQAIFYNFGWERVAGALPDAWAFAPPEVALRARRKSTAITLRRLFGEQVEAPGFEQTVELLERAALSASLEGHPLYAANRALDIPTGPVERLWHATTLLREHRGDGHIAALMAAGVTGRQAHVLHALTAGSPRDVYQLARDLGEEEWSQLAAELRARGLVDAEGVINAEGRALKAGIEATTDDLAAAAFAVLTDKEQRALADALLPLVLAVVHSGEIPVNSPMGLNLAEIG